LFVAQYHLFLKWFALVCGLNISIVCGERYEEIRGEDVTFLVGIVIFFSFYYFYLIIHGEALEQLR
jgi:hypothetical protein